jgi:hypothetical protein
MPSYIQQVITDGGDTPAERALAVKTFFEEITGVTPASKKLKA